MKRRQFPTEQEIQTQIEEAEVQNEILKDIKRKAPQWEQLDRELANNPCHQAPQPIYKTHPIRRGVLIAAAVLVLLSLPVAAMNWEEIAAFFSRQWAAHTRIGSGPLPDEEMPTEIWDSLYMPTWLPDGYHPETTSRQHSYIETFFGDDAGNHFALSQGDADFRIELDNEASSVESVTISGNLGLLVERDGVIRIAWGAAPQFLLSGALPRYVAAAFVIEDGVAYCGGIVSLYDSLNFDYKIQLQKKSGSTWTNIKTWNHNGNEYGSTEDAYTLTTTGEYRCYVTAYVKGTNDAFIEKVTCASGSEYYSKS